jgi:hypothetical membrane protein
MRARSRPAPWLLAAVLAVELAAFAPALVQPGVIRPPAAKASDGTGATIPWHTFWRDEIRSGRLPLWNPFVFGGMPAASEPQMQTFYPPNALWLALRPDTALKTTLLLHVMMGSLLMFGLARELGASELGAAVSSLVFGLHGQMVFGVFAGWTQVVAPLALAPGVLWMLIRGLRPGRAAGAIAIGGLILGLQFLAGSPEWARYTLLAGLVIVIAHPAATVTRRMATGAAILAVGILVGAVQLVPTIEAAFRSTRGQRAMASETNLHGAGLPLVTLPTVVAPRLFGPWDFEVSTDGVAHKSIGARISFGESLIYVGVLPLALAIAAAARRRRETAAWSLMTLAGLALALNDVFHLQCAIDWLVPLHSVFRSPGRFVVVANLGLAVLAGLGVTWLQTTGRLARRTVIGCAAGAVVLAAGALAIIALREPLVAAVTSPAALTASLSAQVAETGGDPASLARWALGQSSLALGTAAALACLSLAAAVWFAAAPGPRRALAILAIVAADLTLYAAPFLTSVVDLDTLYAQDRAVLAPLEGRPDARVTTDTGLLDSGPNVAILQRTRVLGGYDTFVLPEFERLQRSAAGGDPDALAAMGVTHVLQKGPDGPALSALDGARGRAWWTERALTVPDAGSAARMLDAGRPLDFVALEGASLSPAPFNPRVREPTHTIDVDHDAPGRFAARVSAPVDGWLVVTEIFYPGWAATVNGAPVEVRRAFGSLQAVQVPAGTSTVVLRYLPASLRWSLMLSAVGLVLVVGLRAAGRRRSSGAVGPAIEAARL